MLRKMPPKSVNTVMHAGPSASAAPMGIPVAMTIPTACAASTSQRMMATKLANLAGSGLSPTVQ